MNDVKITTGFRKSSERGKFNIRTQNKKKWGGQ